MLWAILAGAGAAVAAVAVWFARRLRELRWSHRDRDRE
jgi:hypothetical protein